ncbi:type VI secretion system PAAR protein [Halodesulfovibrio aestuarii]|uniref:type VI secretion system PAAR protein n=1 Tax=Halodesulfovibrio aestuarii TaxID=126333 RepID=UPI0003F562EB
MKAVKVGDIGTEHDGFHPTKVTAGSGDVFIDGQPAGRVGDPLEPHDKPKHPKHGRTIATGSSTVFINGKPAALTGGKISCGGVTIGSGTVNIGDQPSQSLKTKIEPKLFDRIFEFNKEASIKVETTAGGTIALNKGEKVQTNKLQSAEEVFVIWEER